MQSYLPFGLYYCFFGFISNEFQDEGFVKINFFTTHFDVLLVLINTESYCKDNEQRGFLLLYRKLAF